MPGPGLGVQQLDLLLAPVPRGAIVLLVNDPGVEAEPFLYQAANAHLQTGGRVVYAVTSRPPRGVAAAMEEFGFPSRALVGERLLFLDAYSPLLGGKDPLATTEVSDPTDPAAFAAALDSLAAEHPDAVLLVDSLSTLLDHGPPERFLAAFPQIEAAMRKFRLAAALLTRWPYGDELAPILAGFDGIVNLQGVEERVRFQQYFSVERAAWAPRVDSKPRLFKAMKPGGVVVYIPKVLVTGDYKAGKSSFVRALAEGAVSADWRGTTVAMDHGRATIDGLAADLFGTPGQARFDPLLRTLSAQALGVVVVVDSTRPETFPRAREMLEQTWRRGLPAVIAANKQDLPGALAPHDLAALMGAPERVPVVPCSTRDAASCRAALRLLLDRILERSVVP